MLTRSSNYSFALSNDIGMQNQLRQLSNGVPHDAVLREEQGMWIQYWYALMAISMDISVKIKKQESNGESTSFSPFLRMIYHKTKLGNASSIQRPVFRDYTNFEFRETYDLRSLINHN